MAVTCEDFVIDIAHDQSFKYLQAKQFDHNSRKKRLIITNSNVPIQYSSTRSEYITLSLSINGDNYSNTSCPFENDGYPYITFTESMLSRYGDIDCELRIYDHIDGTIITTFTFMLSVSRSLLNHDKLIKSSEYNILNTLILQALAIRDMFDEYESNKIMIESFISQAKNDIENYQNQFLSLSSNVNILINNMQSFLDTSQQAELNRINAENKRIENEDKRQQEMSAKINEIEGRTIDAIINIENKVNSITLEINEKINNKLDELEEKVSSSLLNIDNQIKIYSDKYYLVLKKAIMNNSNEIFKIYDLIESLHKDVNSGNINGGSSSENISDYDKDYDGGDSFSNNNDYIENLDGGYV